MSYYENMLGRRLWMPEPSLEPPDCLAECSGPRYCEQCERRLDDDEPGPLCWICREETESV